MVVINCRYQALVTVRPSPSIPVLQPFPPLPPLTLFIPRPRRRWWWRRRNIPPNVEQMNRPDRPIPRAVLSLGVRRARSILLHPPNHLDRFPRVQSNPLDLLAPKTPRCRRGRCSRWSRSIGRGHRRRSSPPSRSRTISTYPDARTTGTSTGTTTIIVVDIIIIIIVITVVVEDDRIQIPRSCSPRVSRPGRCENLDESGVVVRRRRPPPRARWSSIFIFTLDLILGPV
jgi:hypothetical protein